MYSTVLFDDCFRFPHDCACAYNTIGMHVHKAKVGGATYNMRGSTSTSTVRVDSIVSTMKITLILLSTSGCFIPDIINLLAAL